MLTKPDIADNSIIVCLHAHFGLRIVDVIFLPLGADVNSAVYRVIDEHGLSYFLKLRFGTFNTVAVAIAAFLQAQGIHRVIAPIATISGALWVREHGMSWLLYPFFEGQNGWDMALSQAQWNALGQSMRAVHATQLPAELVEQMPREAYSPHLRTLVRAYDTQVEQGLGGDAMALHLAAFWVTKRAEIQLIVERSEQLAHILQQRTSRLTVCHSDLHAGNVLVGANDELAIVDWDEPIMAPKERDLMFIGAGIGDNWNTAQESEWFYQGYGPTEIDWTTLSYYRYERIVADIAAYAEQIFGMHGSIENRVEGLRQLTGQFQPDSLIEIAHQTYRQLGSG